MSSVVHLNVRDDRGGAGKVARSLAEGMRVDGWTPKLYYGYAERGRAHTAAPSWATATTTPVRAASNLAIHAAVGRDVVPPPPSVVAKLADDLSAADLVHLHAVHSYWLPLRTLGTLLTRLTVPIVWTMHDHWLFTGRCAQPGSCRRWETGCGACPDRGAYPSSRLDLSASGWNAHRRLVRGLPNVTIVSCAEWLARDIRRNEPGLDVRHIPNGVQAPAQTLGAYTRSPASRLRLLVVGTDLSHPDKQDLELLDELSRRDDVILETAGNHSTVRGLNVINHGHVSGRELDDLYARADALLFTSTIDYYPLVLVEALAAKVPVVAYDSPASREVLAAAGLSPFGSRREVLGVIAAGPNSSYLSESRDRLEHYSAFSNHNMIQAYRSLYSELIEA